MEVLILDDPRINDLGSYKDNQGITHIYVADTDQAFELVDGEWTEREVF